MRKNPKENPEPAANPPALRLAGLREEVRDLEHLLSDVQEALEESDVEQAKSLLDDYFEPEEEEE
jgi:hypothetical protein